MDYSIGSEIQQGGEYPNRDRNKKLVNSDEVRHLTTDELRRNIESLGAEAYDKMSYYERWIYAITQTLIQRGVITVDELGRKIETIRARDAT